MPKYAALEPKQMRIEASCCYDGTMFTHASIVELGRVVALSTRPARGRFIQDVGSMLAVSGVGIEEDVHADHLSLRQLLLASANTYRSFRLPPHALSENLLLDIDTTTLRSGTVLAIGSETLLWLTFHCEPCGQLDVYQSGLSSRIGMQRGILARVIRGGYMVVGDGVYDLGTHMPVWSDHWKHRVMKVLDAVPSGSVVEYGQLARLAGVASTYCRAFPRLLRALGAAYAEKAVTARDASGKPRWLGAGLFQPEPKAS